MALSVYAVFGVPTLAVIPCDRDAALSNHEAAPCAARVGDATWPPDQTRRSGHGVRKLPCNAALAQTVAHA